MGKKFIKVLMDYWVHVLVWVWASLAGLVVGAWGSDSRVLHGCQLYSHELCWSVPDPGPGNSFVAILQMLLMVYDMFVFLQVWKYGKYDNPVFDQGVLFWQAGGGEGRGMWCIVA